MLPSERLAHRVRLLAAAALACASACVAAQTPASGAAPLTSVRAAFACDSGLQLSIRFIGDRAELQWPGRPTQVMTSRPAADGYAYEGGGYRARGKGRALTLTMGESGPAETCLEVRPAR